MEISAVFRPLETLDSIDTDSNRPQHDVLSLGGARMGEPIISRHNHETFSDWRTKDGADFQGVYSQCCSL
jgi:hypothetical protein